MSIKAFWSGCMLIAIAATVGLCPAQQATTQSADQLTDALQILYDTRSTEPAKRKAGATIAQFFKEQPQARDRLILAARTRSDYRLVTMLFHAACPGDPRLAKDLVNLLKGSDEVANGAAEILAGLGEDAASILPQLRELLTSRDFCVGRRALRVIEGLGPIAATLTNDVQAMLDDPAWEVRYAALPTLVAITADKPDVHRPLEQLSSAAAVLREQSSPASQRVAACRQLQQLGMAALPAVFDLQAEVASDGPARVDATYALLAMGDRVSTVSARHVPPPGVLRSGYSPITAFSATTPVEELARAINDPTPRIRLAACAELRSRGASARQALPALLSHLQDPDLDLRAAAAAAMAEIDPSTNAVVLRAATLQETNPNEKTREALSLLHQLQRDGTDIQAALPLVAKLARLSPPSVSEAAQEILSSARATDAGVIAALRKQYRDAVPAEASNDRKAARLSILKALVRSDAGSAETAAVVKSTLEESFFGDRAAEALVVVGPSAAGLVPACLEWLQEQDPLSTRALQVLCAIAPANADAAVQRIVVQGLQNPDASVRRQAAAAVGRMRVLDDARFTRLLELLHGDNPADVSAAARSLAQAAVQEPRAASELTRELRRQIEHASPAREDSAGAACAAALRTVAPQSPDLAELIVLAVQHKDWAVREQLAPAFSSRVKPPALLAALRDLGDSSDSLIQINARCALREIGDGFVEIR